MKEVLIQVAMTILAMWFPQEEVEVPQPYDIPVMMEEAESAPVHYLEYDGQKYRVNLTPEYCPTQEEIELLARLCYAEAGNQSETGKRYVIDTVFNRMDSPHCPDDITGTILQPGQFSTLCVLYNYPVQEDIVQLVYEEMEFRVDYEVFFFGCYGYLPFGTPMFKEGDHFFSKY